MVIILAMTLDSDWESFAGPLYYLFSNKNFFESHFGP